jgi:replicative DNA helicase
LAEFIIAKHRNGSVEDVRLRFIKEQAKFTNWDQINTGMQQPSMDQYEVIESEPYQASSSSSVLQNAASTEFAPF